MTEFVLLAAGLLALVLGALLPPLLSAHAPMQPGSKGSWPLPGASRRSAWIIALALPVFASVVYLAGGRPQSLQVVDGAPAAADAQQATQQTPEALVAALQQRLAAQPDDLQGWLTLARSLAALQRHADASAAFARAAQLAPADADLLADQADALAMAQGGRAAGEPTRLVERALQLDARHLKALAIAATAANERGDLAAAADYWERARAAMAGARISGRVSLAPALASRTAPGDTVFVVARAANGSGPPLAVLQKRVAELPFDFVLDDSLAMAPGHNLSGAKQVQLSARISRSGEATPRTGDLSSKASAQAVGAAGVQLLIDTPSP